jgi:hypothetical protein
MQIADMLSKIVAKNTMVSIHFGEVLVHNGAGTPRTVNIKLSGTTTVLSNIRYLASYSNPTVGDIVLVLINDKDLIVFGHLQP